MDRKYMDVREFVASGLLFEINRTVLHPLGLALAVKVDDDGSMEFGRIWDCRDDPEGILFAPENFDHGHDKYDAYMKERGQTALDLRQNLLGFLVQTSSEQ